MISRHLRRLACIMTAESSKKRLLNRVRSKKGALKQIAECGYIDGGWYLINTQSPNVNHCSPAVS